LTLRYDLVLDQNVLVEKDLQQIDNESLLREKRDDVVSEFDHIREESDHLLLQPDAARRLASLFQNVDQQLE
jgi:hypothetical protein